MKYVSMRTMLRITLVAIAAVVSEAESSWARPLSSRTTRTVSKQRST